VAQPQSVRAAPGDHGDQAFGLRPRELKAETEPIQSLR
jgi:hypothetical protein